MKPKSKIYNGLLSEHTYGEADDILFLSSESEPLGEVLKIDKDTLGNFATVLYYLSDTQKTKEELDENLIRKISGAVEADWGDHYSEYTGYLWTDEEFNVGGHDLMEELHDAKGKWLYMEIKWSKKK